MASPVVSHPRCPDRRERLPISPGFWQEGFLLMCLSFPKGGRYAVASRIFLSPGYSGVRALCTRGALSHWCALWELPLLLVAVLSPLSQRERPAPHGERRKPASLALFLSRHHFIPIAVLSISDTNSSVADVHLLVDSPIRLEHCVWIWVR